MYRVIGLLLGTTMIFPAVAALAAEVYPAKTVRIVVPFAAGGSTDLLARNVAQGLNEAWKQPVVVDNRGGGGGIVGSEHVMRSAAEPLLRDPIAGHRGAAAPPRRIACVEEVRSPEGFCLRLVNS